MRQLKKSLIMFMLLTLVIASSALAQDSVRTSLSAGLSRNQQTQRYNTSLSMDLFNFSNKCKAQQLKKEEVRLARAKHVRLDNEYTKTGNEKGIFLSNPLMLNGEPLEYGDFNLRSTGELTVCKGGAVEGQRTQVPFRVYLRRNGKTILVPGHERVNPKQIRIDVWDVLKHAEPGDHLIIEAINKEDGAVKRILKLEGLGC
jgi:hypothetical protein